MSPIPDSVLVSCIMPTANRRRFVPLAIRCFQAQDYPNRELVVVDDGQDSVADLIPDDPQIRYVRLEGRRTLGAKRNECVRLCRGDLIMHWDDDDWIAPWRISYQAEHLLRERADVCGLDRVLFYEPERERAWLYRHSANTKPWVYGCTLCYTRAFWEKRPFPNVNVGEDTRFIWNGGPHRVLTLPDNRFCVALIHPANTSPKRMSQTNWEAYPVETVRQLMGPDYALYHPGHNPTQVLTSPAADQPTGVNISNAERKMPMFTVAHEADLSLPEFVAFNYGQSLPRMRRWELPFALFNAHLPNTGSVLDCTINPVNFQERLSCLYPYVQYHHCDVIRNGEFKLPMGVPDEAFDRVVCVNTLEHLLRPQREALISAIAHKLKRGGLLILTSDFYFEHFWEQPAFLNAGVMRSDRQEVFNGWNKVTSREWLEVCAQHDLRPVTRAVEEPRSDDPTLYFQVQPYPHTTIAGIFYKSGRRWQPERKKIVLALLTWNTRAISVDSVRAYLREAHMLRRLGQDPLICICDNGSTDGTPEALRALEPEIDVPYRFIFNADNRGNSIARNQIIDTMCNCDADYMLMMDGDIEVVPFSSFAMLRHMENNGSQLGCIGADSAGQTASQSRASNTLYAIDDRRTEITNLVAWTQYGMFRREIFEDGVRFDESKPFAGPGWGFEDNDLAFQMEMKGYLNRRFFGMVYLHRSARSSIHIMRERGIDARALYEQRKQYVINKWASTPTINNGPLVYVRRVTMSF